MKPSLEASSIAVNNKNAIIVDSSVNESESFFNLPLNEDEDILHLFSHGKSGQLFIESQWRDKEEIASWLIKGDYISKVSHLNIYGCSFGKGNKGKSAVAYLQQELGISVAASDDLTGVDGDWELEVGYQKTQYAVCDYPYNLQSSLCNCVDYLYVDDGAADIVHKFPIDPVDGSLGPEVGNPWSSSIGSPHGVVGSVNGNLFISDNNASSLIQVSCDGTILNNDFVNGQWGAVWNMQVVGNSLYTIVDRFFDNETLWAEVDLCTGDIINTYDLPYEGFGYYWGNTYCEDAGRLYYANFGFQGTTGVDDETIEIRSIGTDLVGPPVLEVSYDSWLDIGSCGGELGVRGIDKDEFGNWYINAFCDVSPFSAYVIKLDSDGNYIHHVIDNTSGSGGFTNSYGLVEQDGFVYVSSSDACVAVFSTGGQSGDLTYLPALEVPLGALSALPKAVAVVTECCPTESTINKDTTLCNASIGEQLFLQDVLKCDGAICEGLWQPDSGNTGLNYNACNSTIEIISNDACGVFVLESDGTANNAQCGPYVITFTIEVSNIQSPEINGNQTVCQGDNPDAFSVLTPASGAASFNYQWESSTISCSEGFTEIPMATNSTYDPGPINETTYYRLITEGVSDCSSGMCSDISDCVTVMLVECCPDPNCHNITSTRN